MQRNCGSAVRAKVRCSTVDASLQVRDDHWYPCAMPTKYVQIGGGTKLFERGPNHATDASKRAEAGNLPNRIIVPSTARIVCGVQSSQSVYFDRPIMFVCSTNIPITSSSKKRLKYGSGV